MNILILFGVIVAAEVAADKIIVTLDERKDRVDPFVASGGWASPHQWAPPKGSRLGKAWGSLRRRWVTWKLNRKGVPVPGVQATRGGIKYPTSQTSDTTENFLPADAHANPQIGRIWLGPYSSWRGQ